SNTPIRPPVVRPSSLICTSVPRNHRFSTSESLTTAGTALSLSLMCTSWSSSRVGPVQPPVAQHVAGPLHAAVLAGQEPEPADRSLTPLVVAVEHLHRDRVA